MEILVNSDAPWATTILNDYDNGAGRNDGPTPLIKMLQGQAGSIEMAVDDGPSHAV